MLLTSFFNNFEVNNFIMNTKTLTLANATLNDLFLNQESLTNIVENDELCSTLSSYATKTDIQDLSAAISGLMNKCHVVSLYSQLPKNQQNAAGDIGIVSSEIGSGTGKIKRSAYFWDKDISTWVPLDGNFNASTVYFDEDLQFSKQFGKYQEDANGYSIPSKGKSLKEVLIDAFNTIYYTVRFIVDTNKGSVTGNLTSNVEYGHDAVAPTVQAKDNWIFTGWDKPLTNVRTNLTANAMFEPKSTQLPFYWGYRTEDDGDKLDITQLQSDSIDGMHISQGNAFPNTLTIPSGTFEIFLFAPTGTWNKTIVFKDNLGAQVNFENNNAKYTNAIQIVGNDRTTTDSYDLWYYTTPSEIGYTTESTFTISWADEQS